MCTKPANTWDKSQALGIAFEVDSHPVEFKTATETRKVILEINAHPVKVTKNVIRKEVFISFTRTPHIIIISCKRNRSVSPYNTSLWESWLTKSPFLRSASWQSQRVRFARSEDGCTPGATRWFGSERSATVETEESAVPRRRVGNKVSSPFWVWHDIVHLGVCVFADTCKFTRQGSGWVLYIQRISLILLLWNRNDSSVVLYTWYWRGKPAASARAGLRRANAER